MGAAARVDRDARSRRGPDLRFALALSFACLIAGRAAADAVEVTASARVGASPERVLAVLTDFEAWSRMFSGVDTVAAERCDERHARVRQVVRRAGHTLAYTLAVTVDPESRQVELILDPSEPADVDQLHTVWRVRAHPDGGSLIELRVVTRSGLPVPRFLERRVTQGTARASVDDLVRALAS